MAIFHSYVAVYQRVTISFSSFFPKLQVSMHDVLGVDVHPRMTWPPSGRHQFFRAPISINGEVLKKVGDAS